MKKFIVATTLMLSSLCFAQSDNRLRTPVLTTPMPCYVQIQPNVWINANSVIIITRESVENSSGAEWVTNLFLVDGNQIHLGSVSKDLINSYFNQVYRTCIEKEVK